MISANALLVTKDPSLKAGVEKAVASISGCNLAVVEQLGNAGSPLPGGDVTLVLFHARTPHDERAVIGLFHWLRASNKSTSVVIVSDAHEPLQAIKLLQSGAADYLTRPLDLRRLAFLTDVLTLKARHAPSAKAAEPGPAICNLGVDGSFFYDGSEEMGRIVEQARSVAPLGTTVLLTGETGTGKSRLARLLHELSPRRLEPFTAVNCGALAPSLIESEMFGHVKGAFTGADNDRVGKFAAAGGGTLLLDDIDALPLATQSNLLRAIDERVFEPVGSNRSFPLKARIIVATNRPLEEEVAAGRFRSDLYYRVNVVSLHLPPLRERRSLILPLVLSFAAEFAAEHGRAPAQTSPQAMDAMQAYAWPGNIRELRNVIERALALYPNGHIELSHLPESIRGASAKMHAAPLQNGHASNLQEARFHAELHTLRHVLGKNGNNRSRAARELGISRVTLYKKLREHNLI